MFSVYTKLLATRCISASCDSWYFVLLYISRPVSTISVRPDSRVSCVDLFAERNVRRRTTLWSDSDAWLWRHSVCCLHWTLYRWHWPRLFYTAWEERTSSCQKNFIFRLL